MDQVDVVARGAHGDGERLPADADLQRFLHRQGVLAADLAGGGQPHHPAAGGHAPTHAGASACTCGSSRIVTALETGVLERSATWSSGTSGLVSG
ncbi:Uncharacterised protein [Mycobacteroides abscessus subsp. abscessus]|nr:Uncharacterised protein [Mycobacteroides abscessus subsp. abscessus]